MKRNRNSFFTENSTNFQNYNPNMPNMPYQSASSNFYMGPMPSSLNNDVSERLAKIERQINRLDYRVSKLEGNTVKSTDDYDNNSNSNMYMI